MNPDPVPPVRPLLTHVIADGPLRREAGITRYAGRDQVFSGLSQPDQRESERGGRGNGSEGTVGTRLEEFSGHDFFSTVGTSLNWSKFNMPFFRPRLSMSPARDTRLEASLNEDLVA